ncbi:MAG: hypothetical protein BWY95_02031 [Bacteroidetes bacterium ADurb.BinA104]|nr:MAG: hypothetical protein BWY95_02031 [Bacteroidetes bacterium ADurb.BinA104]
MPDTVCLVYGHMVHVDRYPDITCGIGNPVIDRIVNNKITGLIFPVLYKIDTRLGDCSEIELHIIVLIIFTPYVGFARIDQLFASVVVYLVD